MRQCCNITEGPRLWIVALKGEYCVRKDNIFKKIKEVSLQKGMPIQEKTPTGLQIDSTKKETPHGKQQLKH